MAGGKVMVSGCFDVLHAGHVQFFADAKALGNHLTVVVPSDHIIRQLKKREPAVSEKHRMALVGSVYCVDAVAAGVDLPPELNFATALIDRKPDILAVTEDDKYGDAKKKLCTEYGVQYVVLPKTPPAFIDTTPVSSSSIRELIARPVEVPVRVDLAGGWLDVPKLAVGGGFIVNCAITPMLTLTNKAYEAGGGIGGSAAWSLLNGENPIIFELESGVGWQDPAVIQETGLCVWHSGLSPDLAFKTRGRMLSGRMSLTWTGKPHRTPELVDIKRDYKSIAAASQRAYDAVRNNNLYELCNAVMDTYTQQLNEGMSPLPLYGAQAVKYCGAGHGGYVLRIYPNSLRRREAIEHDKNTFAVEPYIRQWG